MRRASVVVGFHLLIGMEGVGSVAAQHQVEFPGILEDGIGYAEIARGESPTSDFAVRKHRTGDGDVIRVHLHDGSGVRKIVEIAEVVRVGKIDVRDSNPIFVDEDSGVILPQGRNEGLEAGLPDRVQREGA